MKSTFLAVLPAAAIFLAVAGTGQAQEEATPTPTATRSQLAGSATGFPISEEATKDPAYLTPLPEEMPDAAAFLPEELDFKLPWEGTYRISNGYGHESSSWTHQTIGNEASANDFFALDVAMPIGVEILAPADGVILTSQDRTDRDSYGNYMVIDHGHGIHSVYAHLDQLRWRVEQGEPRIEVKQGDLIAISGTTGTRWPHLHFALHQNSRISHSGADVGGLAVVPEPISGYYGIRRDHELTSDNIKREPETDLAPKGHSMRFREWGELPDDLAPGEKNSITDVPGLRVGHVTLNRDEPVTLRTGVTALSIPDVYDNPVAAASFVLNGFGKSAGLPQVDELGTIEGPIFLTNTLSVGTVHEGAVRLAIREKGEVRSFNPVVLECNDSRLSDIASLAIRPEMVIEAYDTAAEHFDQGAVGAGTGMIAYGFKGGIGSASRRVEIDGREYHVGALVLSNYGRKQDLRLPGHAEGWQARASSEENGDGSLIMIVATDVPLLPHQLERVARHVPMAIGMLGTAGSHGSGDFAVAFSTGMRIGSGEVFGQREIIVNDAAAMSTIFRAAAWATAEAILDSMFLSREMDGRLMRVESIVDSLPSGE